MAYTNPALPATGTAVAGDNVGGSLFQRAKLAYGEEGVATEVTEETPYPFKLKATQVAYWPSYGAPPGADRAELSTDPGGALSVRGAVLTDEGTYRVNFANASLAVPIGTCTVADDVVTGTGFAASAASLRDYFKLDADPESAWTQIAGIGDDETIYLTEPYRGTPGTGAASRAQVRPQTGSGGSITVSGGNAVITTGTTSGSLTLLEREVDYSPLISRQRVQVSQRIANQRFNIGLREKRSANPRWYCRFRLDGTNATTVITETGRNPTTGPAGGEVESYTVTLPAPMATTNMLEYRIEQMTEAVKFFVNGVQVAEHTRVIPAAYDIMASAIDCENTGAAASSTTVTVDYITTKNHNKVEVGIFSETERIVAAVPPLTTVTYSQAGAIAINTDLIVVDCSQLRALMIHCVSMGTSGVVTAQWSSTPDFANVVTATLYDQAGASSTTFNAGSILRQVNVAARYFRLRLTTATTGGTTAINLSGADQPIAPSVGTQPVSGTVTAAASTNAIGDVGVQYRANATGAASFVAVQSPATPAAATIKASAGRLIGWQLQNSSSGVRSVKVFNATAPTLGTTSASFTIDIPAGGRSDVNLPGGIGFATAMTYSVTSAKGLTDNTSTGLAANDVSGAFFFA